MQLLSVTHSFVQIECEAHRKFLAGEATSGAQPFVDVWREKVRATQ